MLILTRNRDERIVIEYPNGETVVIEFQKVRSSGVVIGTDASDHIEIVRGELLETHD